MNPDALDRLATRVADRLERAYDAYENGSITYDELVAGAEAVLTVAADQATGLADLALAAWLSATTGTVTAATGVRPRPRNHAEALTTALAVGYDVKGRLGRTGRDVALQAAQDGYIDAMRARDVGHWQRIPSSDACQMCRDLSEAVLPADVDPYHHAGCQCGIRPVITDEQESIA